MSHTVPVQPTTAHAGPPPGVPGIRLWRAAGVLALAHVVLVITGIALMRSPLFQDGTAGIERGYVEGDMARTMAGGMLQVLGFVVLIPALVFLSTAIGRRTEIGGWAAQTALMGGMAYIAVTMAVDFPAGAAALYSAQHGLESTPCLRSTTSASSASSSASPCSASMPLAWRLPRGRTGS